MKNSIASNLNIIELNHISAIYFMKFTKEFLVLLNKTRFTT